MTYKWRKSSHFCLNVKCFCNKMLFLWVFWLHVVLMSLLLLIRTFVWQGLFLKIENELRCHLSCLLWLHKYTVWAYIYAVYGVEIEKSECWQISCFGFFVRRKKRKKRHKFLTDVKNGLMLSKSLFEVVKEPKWAPQRASLTTSLRHFHFVISA